MLGAMAPVRAEPSFRLEKFPQETEKPFPKMRAADAGGGRPGGVDSTALKSLPAYLKIRSAGFSGWAEKGMYVGAQPGRFPQLYQVRFPGAVRHALTAFPRRMAGFYPNPVPARRNFLYTEDEGGNEDFRLGLYDLRGGLRSDLRSGRAKRMGAPPGRVEGLLWDDAGRAFAYSHTPAGTDRWDIRLGRTDGADTLLLSLPGTWSAMDLRPDGRFLLVQKYLSASESELYSLDLRDGALTRLLPGEKPAYLDHAQWIRAGAQGKGLSGTDSGWAIIFTSDREGEFHRLYRLGPGLAPPPVALSPEAAWDVEWAALDPGRRGLAYALNEEGASRIYYLDGEACAAPDSAWRNGSVRARLLPGIPQGVINEAVFRPGAAGGELGFTVNGATGPGDAYSHDIATGKTTRWTRSGTGGLPASAFRAPELVRYPSAASPPASGNAVNDLPRSIPAWLFQPDAKAFPGPRPVLILIHGGPEQQARPAFDPFLQFMVGRLGLAVVEPNVRGSSGYGRSYLKADDGYLRMGSVHDIGALLDWIKGRPDMDASRVAVSGRSYGGFMALSALAEYGTRLRAGVSTVGISHFPTFLAKTSGYRRDLRRAEYGDERDPRMAAFLDSISPLTRLDRIAAPLLLCHGRNDPRVPFEESERVFTGLKARGAPVWFLAFSGEGHAVRDRESLLAQWRVTSEFLLRELYRQE
jgi:acetyl esterase/lipase